MIAVANRFAFDDGGNINGSFCSLARQLTRQPPISTVSIDTRKKITARLKGKTGTASAAVVCPS